MTWRWQPPVLSPVTPRGLFAGLGAIVGLGSKGWPAAAASLRQRYSAADALLTNSGTTALTLALRKVLPPRGTVAFPAYACMDLTTAALGAGARVRLYDLDPATLSPDLDSVRKTCARGVDAIVVAHLYGYPADVSGVREIALERGIPVIEDAAQGAGGTLHTRLLGSLADISVLSFGRGKGMTSGAGGAVLVKTPQLASWIHQARNELGVAPAGGLELIALGAQLLLAHPYVYRLPASVPGLKLGEMVYHPPSAARPMTLAAAAVLDTALRLDPVEVKARRLRAHQLLDSIAKSSSSVSVHAITGGDPGFLRLALLSVKRNRMPRPSIGVLRGYPMTLEQHQPLRAALIPGERAGKGSQHLRDNLFTMPTHSQVGRGDLARIAAWLA
jgi:perosamine synthetase